MPREITGTVAARLAGVSYRQLDYWARTGIVVPSRPARGCGSRREYSPGDLVALAVVGAASRAGITPSSLREIAARVRAYPGTPPKADVLDVPLAGGRGLVLRVPLGVIAHDVVGKMGR